MIGPKLIVVKEVQFWNISFASLTSEKSKSWKSIDVISLQFLNKPFKFDNLILNFTLSTLLLLLFSLLKYNILFAWLNWVPLHSLPSIQ